MSKSGLTGPSRWYKQTGKIAMMGKIQRDIPDDLKNRLETLTRNLMDILFELILIDGRSKKDSIRGKVKAGIYHFDNPRKLTGCSAKLDWALREFQVMSKVDSCPKDLERHEEPKTAITESRDDVKDEIKESRDDVKSKIKESRDDVKDKIKESQHDVKTKIQESRHDMKMEIKESRDDVKDEIQESRRDLKMKIQERRDELRQEI
ncbi:hypothetical protein FRC03_011272 [Tulasnella sp. 419]|nr:hypothetical protein FRC02_005561 [Tulasnella sp. 418]KAG8955237.1 hypothetical protein FRC03_011272 [Tulasnella sp. 419]